MILVLSTDYYEQGTDPVTGYLAREGVPFLRLSVQDLVGGRARAVVDIQRGTIYIDGINLVEEVRVVWFRRLSNGRHFDAHIGESNPIADGLQDEVTDILDFIFYLLRDKIWLPNYAASRLNKLRVLHEATAVGIDTPASRLFTRKDDLKRFFVKHPVITKPVSHNVFYVQGDRMYVSFSKRLDREEISYLSDGFHTALFQQFVSAEHELRVFYLDGTFHTLAAVPQNPDSIPDDIKLARMQNKVLYQPFALKADEEERFDRLMCRLGLNICTMDIMYASERCYLVDVNPFGQYLFESQLGNLYLEKVIAEWLIARNGTANENPA